MNEKIQRMQKRLAELLANRDKYLKKAQEASTAADQLKKEIFFEENNAIATKLRDSGIPPEEFDAIIVHYLSQRKEDSAEEIQNDMAMSNATLENKISGKPEETEALRNANS